MFRSQLKNKFIKSRNNEDWSNYKKQRHVWIDLLKKKSKQNYFGQLDIKHLNDSSKIWKIKPFLSDKGMISNTMIIIEKDKLLWREGLSQRLWTTIPLIYQSLNLKDSSESNVAKTDGNIWHSLKNVLLEDNVSIKNIREKYW